MDQILSKFDEFYELNKPEQESFLAELLSTANNNPERFKEFVRAAPFDPITSPIPVVYESLSKDLSNWGDFFIEEAERIVNLAENATEPKLYLSYLNEFSFIDADNFDQRNRLVELALGISNNKKAIFRYYSLTLLADFYLDKAMDEHKSQLIQFLDDEDWIVRYWAYQSTKELNILPDGRTLKLTDIIRSRLFNTIKYG
jgi:hypothetical protein